MLLDKWQRHLGGHPPGAAAGPGDEQFAAGSQLTLADCELASALFRISLPPMVNRDCSGLSADRYVASSSRHLAIRRVLAEMAPAWELREPA